MARTKITPPAGFKKRTYPQKGSLYQRSPRTLYDDTDFEWYLLEARAVLLNKTVPSCQKQERRKRALKELVNRTGKDSALRPESDGVKKREIMGARDSAKIRRTRKLLGVKAVKRVSDGKESVRKSKGKRSGILIGGDGDGKWVVGKGARRLLGLGIGESTAGSGAGVGKWEKKEREEKAIRELKMETAFWGVYRAVQFSS